MDIETIARAISEMTDDEREQLSRALERRGFTREHISLYWDGTALRPVRCDAAAIRRAFDIYADPAVPGGFYLTDPHGH